MTPDPAPRQPALGRLANSRLLDPLPSLVLSLLVALVVRALNLAIFSELPWLTHYRLDAAIYHAAGMRFAAGDWLMGPGVIHMSPLYSYLLGVIYLVAGDGPWPPLILQLLLGLGTVALVHATTRRLLGAAPALLAGLATALYGPLVFYEAHLLLCTLNAFLHALLLWVAIRVKSRGELRPAGAALVGAIWGLTVLARPSALLLILPLVWFSLPRRWTRNLLPSFKLVAALGVAGAAVISPITVRNLAQAEDFVLVTDSGGLNFYIGNGPHAIGTFRIPHELPVAKNADEQFAMYHAVAEKEEGRRLKPSEVDSYWYRRTVRTIRDNPGTWLRLMVEKCWLFWSARELPNTHDYEFNRTINPILGAPLVQFWCIAPLALLGLISMTMGVRRGERLIVAFVAIFFLGTVAFFVLSHYRLPIVPLLIVAAAAGSRTVWRAVEQRHKGKLLGICLLLALSLPLILTPKLPLPGDKEHFMLGFAYHKVGNYGLAVQQYLLALEIAPRNLSANKNLAQLCESSKKWPCARRHWRRVLDIAEAEGKAGYRQTAQAHLDRLPPVR